jgi:hypothetical protein
LRKAVERLLDRRQRHTVVKTAGFSPEALEFSSERSISPASTERGQRAPSRDEKFRPGQVL